MRKKHLNWNTVYTQNEGQGGSEDIALPPTTARYVRLQGVKRATPYGYSLFEMEVYNTATTPQFTIEVYNNDTATDTGSSGSDDGSSADNGTGTDTGTGTGTGTGTDTGGVNGDTGDTGSTGDTGGTGGTGATGSTADEAPAGFWDSSNIPVAQNVLTFKFLNRTNGKYKDDEIYWKFNDQIHSIAEQPTFDMPANSSGRMYFYLGSPDSLYYDFIEFTIGPTQLNGKTTRVDAFGIKLAMRLVCADGYDSAVGEDYSLFQEDRATTFQRFIDAVPEEFKHLAQIQAPYRIVEPGAGGFNVGGPYQDYYDAFVDELWANNGLTIAKPGPNGNGLGAYPDISAAIYRHVGSEPGTFSPDGKLLNNNLWKDSTTFYQAAPADYYAQFWHDNALPGRAYGFPYDDVGGYSTYISHKDPQYILIAIGW